MVTVNVESGALDPLGTAPDCEPSNLLVFGGTRWLGVAPESRRSAADPEPRRPQILGSAHGPRLLEILDGVAA